MNAAETNELVVLHYPLGFAMSLSVEISVVTLAGLIDLFIYLFTIHSTGIVHLALYSDLVGR